MSKILLTTIVVLSLATVALGQTKVSGASKCGKPDPVHTLEVGDHPDHSLLIEKVACTWTKPLELAGTQDKEYVAVGFDEIRANRGRGHGYVVDTMANGDKAYVHFQGTTILKDGAAQSTEGKWSYAGGTGKLKGIKGKGTYKGTAAADGSMTYEIEGEYTLPRGK